MNTYLCRLFVFVGALTAALLSHFPLLRENLCAAASIILFSKRHPRAWLLFTCLLAAAGNEYGITNVSSHGRVNITVIPPNKLGQHKTQTTTTHPISPPQTGSSQQTYTTHHRRYVRNGSAGSSTPSSPLSPAPPPPPQRSTAESQHTTITSSSTTSRHQQQSDSASGDGERVRVSYRLIATERRPLVVHPPLHDFR